MNQQIEEPEEIWEDGSVHDNSGAFIGEISMCGQEEFISVLLPSGVELRYQLIEVIKHEQPDFLK